MTREQLGLLSSLRDGRVPWDAWQYPDHRVADVQWLHQQDYIEIVEDPLPPGAAAVGALAQVPRPPRFYVIKAPGLAALARAEAERDQDR